MSEKTYTYQGSLNKRLEEEIKNLDSSITDIANETGISRRTIYDLMEEGNSVKAEYLVKLREKYHIDTDYVITGERKSAQSWVNEDLAMHSLSLSYEFTRVPYFKNIKAGSGYGLIEEEHNSHFLAFKTEFISDVLKADVSTLLALKIGGNGMEPVMTDGDDIIIDRKRTRVREGPAFLIRFDEELFVKYLNKMPGGRIKIWSENPSYEPYEISYNQEGFEVVGQLVWHAHVSDYL